MSFLTQSTRNIGRAIPARLRSTNAHIYRALLSLASVTLLIRAVGMINQIIITARFGGGAAMDAYFVASTPPTLLATLIVGALEAAVIPIYAQARTQKAGPELSVLVSTLANLLAGGGVLLTLVLFLFRSQLIAVTAPGLDPARMGLAVALAPFILPALLLLLIIGLVESLLNAEGQFGWPAFAGVLVPLTVAIFALTPSTSFGVVVLCVGTCAGLVLQLCIVVVRMRRAGLVYRLVVDWRNPYIGPIALAAWPVLAGAFIDQGSPLVDQVFASSLAAGSISALNYSLKLVSIATGVIFTSLGRAVLPHLSHQVAAKNMDAFKSTLRLCIWITGGATAALAAFMLLLAHRLIWLLFQRGAFSAAATDQTALTLRGFAVGLVPMALAFLLARAFSALGQTRVLMYSSTFMVIANAACDYAFARLWQSFGIALATSTVYLLTACLLLIVLRNKIGKLDLLSPPPEVVAAMRAVGNRMPQWSRIWRTR